MLKKIFNEPMGLIALIVAILLHFTPNFSELKSIFWSDARQLKLTCSKPKSEEVFLLENERTESTHYNGIRYSIAFPVECKFKNNTKASISVEKYGPAIIDSRRGGAFLFDDNLGGLFPTIAKTLVHQSVSKLPDAPLLLAPREIMKFDSLYVLPNMKIAKEKKLPCEQPQLGDLDKWDGTMCIADKKIPFTNFINTRIGFGFWDWNSYGHRVLLGDGRSVYHSDEVFLYSADCNDPVLENTHCSKAVSRRLPTPYWTTEF